MGDGAATLEAFTSESVKGSPKDAGKVQTMMMVKILILNTNSGLFDEGGEIGNFDRVAVFAAIDFVKQLAVPVQELGADWGGIFGQFIGVRDIFEE